MGRNRQTWISLSPTGLRETKPGHFREMARIAWENRREIDPESREPDYHERDRLTDESANSRTHTPRNGFRKQNVKRVNAGDFQRVR